MIYLRGNFPGSMDGRGQTGGGSFAPIAEMEADMADNSNRTRDEIEDEEDDEGPMYMTMEYDDGSVVETEVMGIFDVGDQSYIAVIPDDDSDDVYLYRYKLIDEESGEFDVADIEDEAEFERAVRVFDELMADEE
jgi:hypothetical protein